MGRRLTSSTDPPIIASAVTEAITADVMSWGATAIRDLPWRRTRDPWAILVSEVMLQQTQVARVIPRWHSFLTKWPTAGDCASVPLADVLIEWQGLGYPRRARNLHSAAMAVRDRGAFPDDLEALLELPGVGQYTARAILAFAFERDVGVVDTNIARVLARVAGWRLAAREAQRFADELVADGDGWTWNQVVMDLGASICRPEPACERCPIARHCDWNAGGRAVPDPAIMSAGVSRPQSQFEGSDRQARGRMLRALTSGAIVTVHTCAATMNVTEERSAVLLTALVEEGLVVVQRDRLSLPGAR